MVGGFAARTDWIARTDDSALVANLFGGIMYDATVSGPEEEMPSSATVFIDVEGSFNYESGAPFLSLGGAIISICCRWNFISLKISWKKSEINRDRFILI